MALSKPEKKAWGEETLVQALDELKYGHFGKHLPNVEFLKALSVIMPL